MKDDSLRLRVADGTPDGRPMTPEEIAEQDREIASLIAQAGQPRCSSQHPGLGLRCDMVRGHADDHWYAELTWPRRRK